MINNWLKFVMFSAVLSLSASARVYADGPGGPGGEWSKGACKEDAQKWCAGVTPGQGGLRDCLKKHEAELSADCKNNIAMMKEKMKKHMEEVNAACKTDEDQFCKDVTPGQGREMACLHAHSDKLSAGCKEVMKQGHHRMKGGPGSEAPKN